ncbi:MAG: gamma-glutamyltransferase, partial [Rhodospirillales bacterium]|nr:gamma-glutamyltransferase [Rhodospirillales bacterium]
MPSPYRARIVGTRHMAAAGHYLAAQAALQILEAGGNAIDAGCAGGMALGVLQSEFVSFGGVAPIMIRPADGGEIVTITGLGHWPKAASLDVFLNEYDGHIPSGILCTVIPAAPDAWITALEEFGTMSFGEVAAAAIRFAGEGFPVYPTLANMIADHEESYAAWPTTAAIFLSQGRPPGV